MLKLNYDELPKMYQIGVDEAGRGPLLGRVYAAAVILPSNDEEFHYEWMKDSKRFHSKKRINEVAEHIKKHAVVWSVQYEDEDTIDKINILQATYSAMHKCINEIINKLSGISEKFSSNDVLLMIDGRYFNGYTLFENGGDRNNKPYMY